MSASLAAFAADIANGRIRVVDLTQTLEPDFPTIVLPPEFGQAAPFRIEEISRYDARGPAWYWNNISFGEHTGTHFDAPAHWVTGRDAPNGTVDSIDPQRFFAPACVIDCSRACAGDPDYLLEPADIAAFEAAHGRIRERAWVLMRSDWSKRKGAAYANLRDDGAHTPRRCAFSSRRAESSASGPRRSARTPVRRISSRRPIRRTRCCMAPAAMGCNASAISIGCRPSAR